jgi:hypothetical protein
VSPQRTIAHYNVTAKLGEGGPWERANPRSNSVESGHRRRRHP